MSLRNRRQFLRSGTALIALPFLESLDFRRFAASTPPAPRPKRMVFLGFGWGVTEAEWYPKIDEPGTGYTLPPMLEPLARHKDDFTIVQGLWNRYTGNGHYGSTFWLTGANEHSQPGQSFHNSVSVDQVAANTLGAEVGEEILQAALPLEAGVCPGADGCGAQNHSPGIGAFHEPGGEGGVVGPHRASTHDHGVAVGP